jgi:hypothetical protein
MTISPKAIQLIDQALNPLIESGCRIEQIKMVVAAGTEIAEYSFVQTKAGALRVEPNNFVRRGKPYLIEDHNRGFNWVR